LERNGFSGCGKRVLENEIRPGVLQGLKPDVDLTGIFGTTEVMPCYKAFEIEK